MTAMPTPPSGSTGAPRAQGAPSTTHGNAAASSDGMGKPLLTVDDLKVWFPITGGVLRRRVGWVYAVDGVSLVINKGETLGLVGESGSGKTTTGRAIVRINQPTAGKVTLAGEDLLALKGSELRRRRRKFQMVFQDP